MANNTMTKLATTTVGSGGAASVTFSAIPQNYTDLLIKTSLRDSVSGTANAGLRVIFNGSGSGFSTRYVYGDGGATYSTTDSGGWIRLGQQPASGATANTFSNDEIYIPNYTSSNYKSVSGDSVGENNGTTAYATLAAGLWSNTAAITSIQLQSNSTAWVQYSEFTLYGVYAGGTTTPSAPTIASATDLGGGTAQVAISSPAAIPYTVTSSPGGITATGMSPIQISGLSPQTSYTFTAQAVAPFGVSATSSASSSVSMYNGMTALQTVTVGAGGATSVTFSSIPSGYSHLQIRYSVLASQLGQNLVARFNGDSTTSYFAGHRLTGDGANAAAGAYTTDNAIVLSGAAGTNALANAPTVGIIDILDYSNTSKNKTLRMLFGYDTNGAGTGNNYQWVGMQSGLWMSTSAITSIVMTSATLNQYSTFVLYGVK